jgi:ParB-like chromosome segregation protein Spo0J
MEIREMNIDDLIPAEYNPRKDLKPGDKEYEKLRKSISEFGYVETIVWNEKTGKVVGGHQRLKVLKDLGYEKVKVSVVNLDEKKEKALNIALNKIEGKWDNQLLKDLLQELDSGDFDMELTGFDDEELEKLLIEDEIEEKPEIEFTEELLEEHNYIVLYFDNQIDWQTAVEKLGIKTVKALDSKEGYERKGVGRVIRGADILERIQ